MTASEWERAQRLSAEGQWAEACQIYQDLVAQNPQDIALRDHLAVAYAQGGQLQHSAKVLQEALALAPMEPRLHNHYGNILRAQGDMDGALRHYREALHYRPHYAEAHNNLGALYYRQGRLEEAIAAFQKALRIDPGAVDAQYNLANSYVRRDTPLEAIPHYEAVLRQSPAHLGAHHNLGILLATLSQFKEAKPHLYAAMAADTATLDAHFHYAMALSAEGQCEEAIGLYQKVLETVPHHAHAHHNIAVMYLTLKQTCPALTHFEQALKLNPNNTTALHFCRALRQEAPSQAPTGYIRDLFDHYASHYDQHLTGALAYQVPHQLRTLIGKFIPYSPIPWFGIDLGCGTGLCGIYFQDLVGALIGIDISENMIQVARARGGYQDLHVGDIGSILEKHYKAKADLLIAADVLVYYGDLAQLFEQCSASLKVGGYFCFSVEDHPGPTLYQLKTSGRFAHQVDYIKNLAAQYHLQVRAMEHACLRQQEGMPIMGSLWVLEKTA